MNEPTTLPTTVSPPSTKKGEETKARILAAATELIHRNGFRKTGLTDILVASGVPKGSFYFYFESKDALGKELLARFRERQRELLLTKVFPPDGRAMPQLLAFFQETLRSQTAGGCKAGCLLGNLAAEITDENPGIQQEVAETFLELKQIMAGAIARGQASGELRTDFAADAAAEFLISVMEGSILVAKARRDPAAIESSTVMIARYLTTLATEPGTASTGGRA
jgi:TetR/AcrR family transcriptional repressor of nem operon